jgi:DNA ligase (NAD+)
MKLTDRFVELGWIKDAADIYFLNWDAIAQLDGLGEKSANNLQEAVEESKARPLWRVINALGIRHIGERTATLLADRFGSIESLTNASLEQINAIGGIGEVVAQSVYDFFQEERNRAIILKLGEAGVKLADERSEGSGQPAHLAGKAFVLTGRLNGMTRPQAEERLRQAGATVSSAVSKKTSYVVAGEEAGSKADRARELKVPIIDEDELVALLAGGSNGRDEDGPTEEAQG